ncbi:MAG: hypothetical protein LBI86_09690 [Treponema sp.]|jgi:hypothetical protein|nr:hypothetical protein [Treponema sp.]
MDASKGTFSQSHSTILHGDRHIIVGGGLAADLSDLPEGLLLKEVTPGAAVYTPAALEDVAAAVTVVLTGSGPYTATAAMFGAFAVLAEDVADSNSTDVAAVVVQGPVRREKIRYSGGTPLDAAGTYALRIFGVHAL